MILWLLLVTAVMQLNAAQNIKLSPLVLSGTVDTCSPQHSRDMARNNLTQSALTLLRSRLHPCSGGDWTRVAYLNMSDPSQQCPSPWRLYSANGVRSCGRPTTSSGSCYSQFYTVQRSYSRVCGRIIGYQVGSTDIFTDMQLSIDDQYVDGISLTHGTPRQHIWTFAAGLSETIITNPGNHEIYTCPCALVGTGFRTQVPPAFVGNNYFCESGNPLSTFQNTNTFEYTDDPLWDGQKCEGHCCNGTISPPWFRVQLPSTTSDNIEIRICSLQGTANEDTPIGLLEIYVE